MACRMNSSTAGPTLCSQSAGEAADCCLWTKAHPLKTGLKPAEFRPEPTAVKLDTGLLMSQPIKQTDLGAVCLRKACLWTLGSPRSFIKRRWSESPAPTFWTNNQWKSHFKKHGGVLLPLLYLEQGWAILVLPTPDLEHCGILHINVAL